MQGPADIIFVVQDFLVDDDDEEEIGAKAPKRGRLVLSDDDE